MNQESTSVPSKDLRSYIATIRQHKWVILVTTLLLVLATLLFTLRQPKLYTSSARVRVTPAGNATVYGTGVSSIDMPSERAAAQSSVVAGIVQNTEHLPGSPDSLLAGLSVTVEPDTDFLVFQYTDPSPKQSQVLANAFANAYLQNRRDLTAQQTQAQVDDINNQLVHYQADFKAVTNQLSHAKPDSPSTTSLTNRQSFDLAKIDALEAAAHGLKPLPGAGGVVFQSAVVPTTPSSPVYSRNLALALIIGLALGTGVAFLREHLNEGLRGSSDLEEQMQAPILAAIPHVNSWKQRDVTQLIVADAPHSPIAEAYRTLRTNLEYVARDPSFKILSVTSPTLGEGKTTTVANLAAVLAQAGKRVIAVSCDLRKPRLHRFFGLTNDVGVTSILSGKATLAQAAQRPAQGLDTLRVLASGPVPPNPAELLGSNEMRALLEELRMFADFVVLDTPPVLAVADALVLGPQSDGVLIVADAHGTSRQGAAHTREQLHQVDCKIVGCVFNNFDPGQAKYYPYDSRYYYSSYAYADGTDMKLTDQTSGTGNGNGNGSGNGHKDGITAEDMWGTTPPH